MNICIGTKVLVRAFGMGIVGRVTGYMHQDYVKRHGNIQYWEVTLEGCNPTTKKEIRVLRQADSMVILKD